MKVLSDRTGVIGKTDVLVFSVLRNEMLRLPHFLDHYRALGVGHFLMVDNASDDGSAEYLKSQPDVSLWNAESSYRQSRFGVDWLTWLQIRYGHGHWTLTVDVDELLVYARSKSVGLDGLTHWLDANGYDAFGALMLDLYPKGRLDQVTYLPGQDPKEVLHWFDNGPFRTVRQSPMSNLWVQGGTRERVFFADRPTRSPTLNKLPLVRWSRRYAYVNSCHSILPPEMNHRYDGPQGALPSGVLLHTKFLPDIGARSETEKMRGEHFASPDDFGEYYDQLMSAPDLWHDGSTRYHGEDQLVKLGLMTDGAW